MSYSRLLLALIFISLTLAGCAAMQSLFGIPAGSDTSAAQDGAKTAATFLGVEAGNAALGLSNIATLVYAGWERNKRKKAELAA